MVGTLQCTVLRSHQEKRAAALLCALLGLSRPQQLETATMDSQSDAGAAVSSDQAACGGNIVPMEVQDAGERGCVAEIQTTIVSAGQENSNLQSSGQRVQHVPTTHNSDESSLSAQQLAGQPPEAPGSAQLGDAASTAPAAPVAAEALIEAAKEMYVDGNGVPAASINPPIATVASKELVIKARDAVATAFKAAGLEGVRRSWGRKLDKREALFYLLGWALGRGLLPIGPADEKRGEAGDKGDRYWLWAGRYDSELAAQRKRASAQKSALKGDAKALAAHLEAAAKERTAILTAPVELELPSPQRCAAVERHARPKPEPPIRPIEWRDPLLDLTEALADAEAELDEKTILHQAALLKAERMAKNLTKLEPCTVESLETEFCLRARLEELGYEEGRIRGGRVSERERQKRMADARRYDEARQRERAAQCEEAEAELAVVEARVRVAGARHALEEKQRTRDMHEAMFARAHRVRALELQLASALADKAGHDSRLAKLDAALAAAESQLEAAVPEGVPMAEGASGVVVGTLVDEM